MGYINATSGQGTGLFFLITSILFVAMRFAARYIQKSRRGWDDWLCVPAMILSCIMGITLFHSAKIGMFTENSLPTSPNPMNSSQQMQNMSEAQKEAFGIIYVYHILQLLSLGVIKTSVLLFYRRIFCTGSNRKFHWASIVMVALTIAWTIGFLVPMAIPCKPPQMPPSPMAKLPPTHGWCSNLMAFQQAFVLSDFLMDLLVILFPVPVIWSLQMTRSRKAAVTGIFALGCLSVAASAARFAFFVPMMKPGFHEANSLGAMVVGDTMFWGMMETGIALIAACLPTSRLLFTKLGSSSVFKSLRARWSRLSSKKWSRLSGHDQVFAVPRAPQASAASEIREEKSKHKPLLVASVRELRQNTSAEEIDTISMAKYGGMQNHMRLNDMV